jgi:hypothetical protein
MVSSAGGPTQNRQRREESRAAEKTCMGKSNGVGGPYSEVKLCISPSEDILSSNNARARYHNVFAPRLREYLQAEMMDPK